MIDHNSVFTKIENEVMKILTRNVCKYKNQFEIYNELLEDMAINDPKEREDFKIKFLLVLRKLPSIFDDVIVKKNDGVLKAIYLPKGENIQNDDLVNIYVPEIINSMPTEKSVINFIVDEEIEKYYNQKDYLGNTILHYLISNNDFQRIMKVMDKCDMSPLEKNIDNICPIDMITNINIVNIFIKDLLKKNIEKDKLINDLKDNINNNKNELNNIKINLSNGIFILKLCIVSFFIYYFYSIIDFIVKI
jgi:hypothetical protein